MYAVSYCLLFDGLGAKLTKKTQKALQLLAQLKQQVHTKKAKNVDILSLSQEVSLMSVHTHTVLCELHSFVLAMSDAGWRAGYQL